VENANNNLEALRRNIYPGRGIVLGLNKSGSKAVQIYWLMGRSENSRNRILIEHNGTVRTAPFDETKVKDSSLIIYTAMLVSKGGVHIVSNGDHTETIVSFLDQGKTFEEAVRSRTFEPDIPNFTPRIAGITKIGNGAEYKLSITRRGERNEPVHEFFPIVLSPGTGFCIHTYEGDGTPIQSFKKAPFPVPIGETADEIIRTYWEVLNPENRVAIVVKIIDLKTANVEHRIENKLTSYAK